MSGHTKLRYGAQYPAVGRASIKLHALTHARTPYVHETFA